jgi:hypothetical protein
MNWDDWNGFIVNNFRSRSGSDAVASTSERKSSSSNSSSEDEDNEEKRSSSMRWDKKSLIIYISFFV